MDTLIIEMFKTNLNDPDRNYVYIILSPSLQEYNFKFVGDLDL